jgi:TonB family protein
MYQLETTPKNEFQLQQLNVQWQKLLRVPNLPVFGISCWLSVGIFFCCTLSCWNLFQGMPKIYQVRDYVEQQEVNHLELIEMVTMTEVDEVTSIQADQNESSESLNIQEAAEPLDVIDETPAELEDPVEAVLEINESAEMVKPVTLLKQTVKKPTPSTSRTSPRSTNAAASSAPSTGTAVSVAARRKYTPSPSFPEWARRDNIQGTIQVKLWVNELGRVNQTIITRSCGHSRLDSYVADFIKSRYQFSSGPAFSTSQNITFKLN